MPATPLSPPAPAAPPAPLIPLTPYYRRHRDPRSSHQQISTLLRQLRPRAILDVGAAQGILAELLQGTGLTLDAIEPQPNWALHARPLYRRVFDCTVEQAIAQGLAPAGYDA